MRTFFGIVLLLVAILSGGCSLLFSTWVLGDLSGDAGVLMIWLGGILIAALSIWGAIVLLRRPDPRSDKTTATTGSKDGTGDQ